MLTAPLSQDDDDELEINDGGWLELLTPQTLLILGVVLLVLLIVAAIVGWIIFRRLRRSQTVRRWAANVRTQAQPPGPKRDLSELRVQVQDIRNRTSAAVQGAEERGTWRTAPADLPTLAGRLEESAADLDERIAGHERQPEQRVREALPQLREQVQLMEECEATLHRGLELASLPSDIASIERIQQEMDDEVHALEAYRQAYRDFGDGKL